MAAPAYVSVAPHSGNPTTSATATLSTTAANDILIASATNGGANVALSLTGTYSGSWTSLDSGGWTSGWGGVWWSRCTGNHTGQTVIASTATDSCSLQVARFSGCITSGNPYDTNISAATVASGANAALAAFTTTVADTLVVLSWEIDDNINAASPTKGGVAMENLVIAASTGGADSQAGYASLAQAVAGSTGAFALTFAAGTNQGKRMTGFALKPPAAATVERSAVVGATAAVTSTATFFSVFDRSAAIASTGAVASNGEFETPAASHERSAAIGATGAVASVGQRDLIRSLALSASGAVASDGHGVVARAAALAATGAIASAPQRVLLRQVVADVVADINATGAIEGGAITHDRSVAFSASAAIASQATFWTLVERAVGLDGTAALTAAGQAEPGGEAVDWSYATDHQWTYGPFSGWQYTGGTASAYTGGTAWNYGG